MEQFKREKKILPYYDNFPVALQVNVTDGYFVWTTWSLKYCFTVAFPVALFPDFEALLEVTFQSPAGAVALTVAFVQVEEVPVYVNVPVTLTV